MPAQFVNRRAVADDAMLGVHAGAPERAQRERAHPMTREQIAKPIIDAVFGIEIAKHAVQTRRE
jgi:hypothetical protein